MGDRSKALESDEPAGGATSSAGEAVVPRLSLEGDPGGLPGGGGTRPLSTGGPSTSQTTTQQGTSGGQAQSGTSGGTSGSGPVTG